MTRILWLTDGKNITKSQLKKLKRHYGEVEIIQKEEIKQIFDYKIIVEAGKNCEVLALSESLHMQIDIIWDLTDPSKNKKDIIINALSHYGNSKIVEKYNLEDIENIEEDY